MKLGSSIRRRRPSGNGGPRRKPRREDRGRARLFLLAVGVILMGSGGGYLYATHVVFPGSDARAGNLREVPDLRGMVLEDAGTVLRDRGFEVGRVDSIRHPGAPPGWILGQSPLPGQLAAGEGPIELTLSLGPERRPVPDVTRLRADRALTVLQTTGFTVVVDSIEADLPEGRVVATEPATGADLPLPAEVRLTVSLGPPLLPMPDLAGLQEDVARMVLDSLGLVMGEVETRFRFGFNQGEILEQFPRADSLIAPGTSVRLVIGRRGFF